MAICLPDEDWALALAREAVIRPLTDRPNQDAASIREPAAARPEFFDEQVDQTSRDPKLIARRNKFFSHFRLITWRFALKIILARQLNP
jgi:hypothetical protein